VWGCGGVVVGGVKKFFFGVLYQAVRAVSKNRPKYPMLDIPFDPNLHSSSSGIRPPTNMANPSLESYIYILDFSSEAGTITFILISDQIVDHYSKIDLRSYQDHMAVK
jgi:hypothetical protein